MRSRLACFTSLLLCFLAAPSSVSAETPGDQAEYDSLIDRALAAFEGARYPEARSLFEAAHALQPSARTLRGLGLTAFEQRDYDTAQQELQAALRSTLRPLTPVQRVEVGELLAWMEAGLGTLQLTLSPEHAIAEIDDRARAPGRILLDPGEHRLHVHAESYRSETRVFSLELGQPLVLHVELPRMEAASLPAPPPLPAQPASEASESVFTRWWFWTAVGVVAAGIVVSTVALTAGPESTGYEPGGVDGVVRTLRRERSVMP